MSTPAASTVTITTSLGAFTIRLFPDVAPKTCENFTTHCRNGYYDGVVFHRVIPDFMIQGGDPTGTGRGGKSIWGGTFGDECSPKVKFDKPGLLAMANAGPGTNGSQFFVTVAKTEWLHGRHTIFGEVIDGYAVVESISKAPRDASDRPRMEVKILSAKVS